MATKKDIENIKGNKPIWMSSHMETENSPMEFGDGEILIIKLQRQSSEQSSQAKTAAILRMGASQKRL